MKFVENGPYGSFTAQGTGFLYSYNACQKSLAIYRTGGKTPLFSQNLDAVIASEALHYCDIFEKATQIKALKFSNKKVIDLSLTLTDDRLGSILQRTSDLSFYAFHLKKEIFQLFTADFSCGSSLRRMTIEKKASPNQASWFYHIEAHTRHGHIIKSRSSTLHGSLTYLSDSIIQDIITKEYGYGAHASAQQLLDTARMISTLSFIINPGFDPSRKVNNESFQFFAPGLNTNKVI